MMREDNLDGLDLPRTSSVRMIVHISAEKGQTIERMWHHSMLVQYDNDLQRCCNNCAQKANESQRSTSPAMDLPLLGN